MEPFCFHKHILFEKKMELFCFNKHILFEKKNFFCFHKHMMFEKIETILFLQVFSVERKLELPLSIGFPFK